MSKEPIFPLMASRNFLLHVTCQAYIDSQCNNRINHTLATHKKMIAKYKKITTTNIRF